MSSVSRVVKLVQDAIAQIDHPNIYLAAPVRLFDSDAYRRAIAWAERTFPQADVSPSHKVFASLDDWLEGWPEVAGWIDLAVVVSHPDGAIGRGVFDELSELERLEKPVLWWRSARDICPALSVKLRDEEDWQHYARLSPIKPRKGAEPRFTLRIKA